MTTDSKKEVFTRAQYMAQASVPGAHERYYDQFVTDEVRGVVAHAIGRDRVKASLDPHFNDIPLGRWDKLPALRSMAETMKECGDYLTLACKVCIYKAAARQIRDARDA